jgi:hypothetical protein
MAKLKLRKLTDKERRVRMRRRQKEKRRRFPTIIQETMLEISVGRALSSPAYHTWDDRGMPVPHQRPVQDPPYVLTAHRGPDGCIDRDGVRGVLTRAEWLGQE